MAVVFRFKKFSASGLVGSGTFLVLQTAANEDFTIKNAVVTLFGAGAISLDIHVFPVGQFPSATNKVAGTFVFSGVSGVLGFIPLQNMVIPTSHEVRYNYVKINPFTPNGTSINTWLSGVTATDQP